MVRARFFYAWLPFLVVAGTAVLLTIPYLAVIALALVVLVALAALAWAIVALPLKLGRAVGRRWRAPVAVSPRPVPALAPARTAQPQLALYTSNPSVPKGPVS